MTPTIVEKDGKLWMVLGTPGGSRIITSVLQTLLNVYEFEMDMQQAADAPRFHHQWLPDELYVEDETLSWEVMKTLKNKGYTISQQQAQIIGSITAILILESGKMQAGADKRRDNAATGY
jgi:gamma-glutamyltranspeptidase/glutathione hydrolase